MIDTTSEIDTKTLQDILKRTQALDKTDPVKPENDTQIRAVLLTQTAEEQNIIDAGHPSSGTYTFTPQDVDDYDRNNVDVPEGSKDFRLLKLQQRRLKNTSPKAK